MRTTLFPLLLLLHFSARADKVLVASCSEGKGCTFSLSDVETDMARSFGGEYENLKPGSMLVFGQKKNGTEITYVEDHKTRSQIDRQWGGDGYTQIYLFDPFIQPADGTWKAEYGSPSGNECYGIGDVGAYMRKFIQRGTAGRGPAGAGNITFRNPFSPAQLFPSTEMKWRQTGYSRYAGVIDFGSNELAGFKLHYTIHVVSPKKIETVYTMTMKIPTKGQCTGVIPVTFTLVKGRESDRGDDWEDDQDSPEENDLLPVKPGKKEKPDNRIERLNDADDDLLPVKPGKKDKPDNRIERLNDADDDLLPVKPKKKEDDLLPVKSRGKKDDLLPVKSKN